MEEVVDEIHTIEAKITSADKLHQDFHYLESQAEVLADEIQHIVNVQMLLTKCGHVDNL